GAPNHEMTHTLLPSMADAAAPDITSECCEVRRDRAARRQGFQRRGVRGLSGRRLPDGTGFGRARAPLVRVELGDGTALGMIWCFHSAHARGTLRPRPESSDSSAVRNTTSAPFASWCACICSDAFSVA